LQTYASAIVFSPQRSLIREHFKREEPDWMILKPRMEADWNACLQTLEGHGDSVSSVAVSADGGRLASGSGDTTVKVWDAATGACLQTLEGHGDEVTSVAFSADSGRFASGSYDTTVKVWDAATGACVLTLEVGQEIAHLSFDPMISSRLSTDIGLLNLDLPALPPAIDSQSTKATPRGVSHSGYGMSTDGVWIVKDGTRMLWLPPEHRAAKSAVAGLTVAIGCSSGRVLVMKFSSDRCR
jgi:WD40 repeat protein